MGIHLLSPAEPPDPMVVAARGAAEGALTALYYDVFPPPDYRGGPLASPAAAVIRARVVADIERYFSPSLQARYEPMILGAVDTIGSGEWEAAGGFSSLDWKGISVTDDHATLGLRASGWVLRRGGADGVAPDATTRLDSTWDWSFTLVRIDGLWRVDTLDATCVRGCP
ncbi:MAG: hypothetical protein HY263_00495 [Chloroflexi bacterium]|nr:hypothetical protein [Chloroflexota bacterium]